MFCDNNGCELLAANTWVILVHRIVLLLYQLFTHYYLFASPTGKEALAISQGRVMDCLRLRRGALVAVLVFCASQMRHWWLYIEGASSHTVCSTCAPYYGIHIRPGIPCPTALRNLGGSSYSSSACCPLSPQCESGTSSYEKGGGPQPNPDCNPALTATQP